MTPMGPAQSWAFLAIILALAGLVLYIAYRARTAADVYVYEGREGYPHRPATRRRCKWVGPHMPLTGHPFMAQGDLWLRTEKRVPR